MNDLLESKDEPTEPEEPETVTVTVEENPEVDVYLNGEIKVGANEYEKGSSLVIEAKAKDPEKQDQVVLNVSEVDDNNMNVAPQVLEVAEEPVAAKAEAVATTATTTSKSKRRKKKTN